MTTKVSQTKRMSISSRMIVASVTLLIPWFIIEEVLAANPSVFQSYNLKYGITVRLPKNWQILESQLMEQLNTNTEIITGVGQGNNDIVIAANYYDGRTSSAAATARVSVRTKRTASQSDIAQWSQAELDAQADQGYKLAVAALMKSGDKTTTITPYKMTKDKISGYVAIRADYQEMKFAHKKNVSIYTVYLGDKIVKVTMSYDEAQASLLASTINEIKDSIQIKASKQ